MIWEGFHVNRFPFSLADNLHRLHSSCCNCLSVAFQFRTHVDCFRQNLNRLLSIAATFTNLSEHRSTKAVYQTKQYFTNRIQWAWTSSENHCDNSKTQEGSKKTRNKRRTMKTIKLWDCRFGSTSKYPYLPFDLFKERVFSVYAFPSNFAKGLFV